MGARRVAAIARAALMLGAGLLICATTPAQNSLFGEWMNPNGTVKVRTSPCGQDMCGWVIWADEDAIHDAKEAGTPGLVGTEILRNYKQSGNGGWQGEVFIPDMGDRFFSRIKPIDAHQIKVSGCILHGLFCKSQLWHRS